MSRLATPSAAASWTHARVDSSLFVGAVELAVLRVVDACLVVGGSRSDQQERSFGSRLAQSLYDDSQVVPVEIQRHVLAELLAREQRRIVGTEPHSDERRGGDA
jgi:hypothetical protein